MKTAARVRPVIFWGLTFFTLLTIITAPAFSQCEFDWKPGQGIPGVNGTVYAITAWDPDGAGPQPELLVVGGSFTVAGDVLANGIAAWDGISWHSFGSGMGGNIPVVNALTVYNGELIAGGSFTSAGDVEFQSIVRWDGSSWKPLGLGLDGYIYALTVSLCLNLIE